MRFLVRVRPPLMQPQGPDRLSARCAPPTAELPYLLIEDGKLHRDALKKSGHSEDWLAFQMKKMGYTRFKEALFVSLDPSGFLQAQDKVKFGGKVRTLNTQEGKNAQSS